MNKKGQAALEFLSTYGFAFLIILVMVGALAYFGVLNPQKFLPDRCLLGTEFECRDWQITNDGANFVVNVLVGNNLGQTIQLVDPLAPGASMPQFGAAGVPVTCDLMDTTVIPWVALGADQNVASGAPFGIQCTFLTGAALPPAGEKVKVDLDFTWRELGGAFDHRVQGEVFTQVQ